MQVVVRQIRGGKYSPFVGDNKRQAGNLGRRILHFSATKVAKTDEVDRSSWGVITFCNSRGKKFEGAN